MNSDLRIPFEPGPLFARTEELGEIRSALSHPLVTLVGPGGVGKTRIATRLAHELDRVAFCELAATTDRTELLQGVADAIGYANAQLTTDALIDEIRNKNLDLLILDNAEHLLGEISSIVSDFLSAHVRVLVTSREPLRLTSECVVPIRPFDPEEGESFLKFCAEARKPMWANTLLHSPIVTQIVEHLDGLPLALELVVGQLGIVEPEEILQRLTEGAVDDRQDRDERHATLHSVLMRSWEVLTDDEKTALIQLASFVEHFSRDAATAVVDTEDAMSVVARLVEKSLVSVHGGLNDTFYMYKTVRDFVDRLDGFEEVRQRAYRRHAEYILAGGPVIDDPRLLVALRNDAIAAFRRFRTEDPDLAAHLVFRAGHALDSSIEYRTIIRLVDSALELEMSDASLRIVLIATKAICLSRLGSIVEALDLLNNVDGTEGLDSREMVVFLDAKAEIQRALGHYTDAFETLKDALALAETLPDRIDEIDQETAYHGRPDPRWLHAVIVGHTLIAAWCVEEFEAASTLQKDFERAVKQHEDEWPELAPYPSLVGAEIAFDLGDFEEATRRLDDAATYPSSGKRFIYQVQTLRGWLKEQAGDHDAARELWNDICAQEDDETAKYTIPALWALHFSGEEDAFERIALVLSEQDYLNMAHFHFLDGLMAAEDREFARAARASEKSNAACEKLRTPGLTGLVALLQSIISGSGELTLRIDDLMFEIDERVAWSRDGAPQFVASVSRSLKRSLPGFVRWRGADFSHFLRRVVDLHVNEERAQHPERILWVSDDGESVVVPGGGRIDFSGRTASSRIVRALAQNWSSVEPLSRDDLLNAGWPDEFVEENAGANRVYSAVKTIRKQGLERWLISEDGYHLDHDTIVVIGEPPS